MKEENNAQFRSPISNHPNGNHLTNNPQQNYNT